MATVHIVCGPPCAGKSTYVLEHAGTDDLIIDWDEIVESLGFPPRHHFVERGLVGVIADEWRRRIARAKLHDGVVWVIRAKPAREVRPLATSLGADIIEITAPVPVLLERASHRPHPEAHRKLILSWHARARRR